MFRLEARAEPSRAALYGSPLLALGLTLSACTLLFVLLGTDPWRGLQLFFVEPLKSTRALGELSLKVTPLLLMGLGLSLSFRANVWNVGAEGQFILGAVCASGVALRATEATSSHIVPLLLLAGAAGGMFWAALVALPRDRWGASEILLSLMLVYVAEQLLSYLVHGPWRDPGGYNFPQTATFAASTRVPRLLPGSRANAGMALALLAVGAFWLFTRRTERGFQLLVSGLSPAAARYAGFSSRAALWSACLISGAMAGLAGALEVAGPLGQLTPHVPVGYGFGAIIVAFVGRLEPLGVVLSSVLLSMFYIGGELAQSRLGLPRALTSVFQGLLLVALLGTDTLVHHRLRWRSGTAPFSDPAELEASRSGR